MNGNRQSTSSCPDGPRAEKRPRGLPATRRYVWTASVIVAAMLVMGGLGGASVFGQPATPRPDMPAGGVPIVRVDIVGNRRVPTSDILRLIQSQAGQTYDPIRVRRDVRRLYGTKRFHQVRTETKPTEDGIVLVFHVAERPVVEEILFIGNRAFGDGKLLKESGLAPDQPLNVFQVHEARRKLLDFYAKKGRLETEIEISEGLRPTDRRIVFLIHEGPIQRIAGVAFVGNDESVIPDGRLHSIIRCHSKYLGLVAKPVVDYKVIDEDVDRITSYYRSLGYFRARVSRELDWDTARRWVTVRFHIDEGPRYRIRDVRIVGAKTFDTADLIARLDLKKGEFFSLASLQRDQRTLADVYGSEGYIFSKVDANPRFLEEPGWLDLVYHVKEGERFQVGRINVHIQGDTPHTKRTVVLNRLSVRPGDIADIRKIRASESRLKASPVFFGQGQKVRPPRIEIKPPETVGEAKGEGLK